MLYKILTAVLKEGCSVQPANFSMWYSSNVQIFQIFGILYVKIHMKNGQDTGSFQYYLYLRNIKHKQVWTCKEIS